jgi:MFS family permease
MRLPPPAAPKPANRREQLREGLGYIASEPVIRTLLLLAGSLSLFGLVYYPLLPAFARTVLHTDASGLGWLATSSGLGALTAALLLARFSDKVPRGRLLQVAMLLFPLFLIGLTLMRSVPTAMAMAALVGWSGVTALALTNTLIQSLVPDGLRARVMSVFTMLLMGFGPFGALLAGGVAQAVGDVALVIGCSAVIAWVIVLTGTLRLPHLRNL